MKPQKSGPNSTISRAPLAAFSRAARPPVQSWPKPSAEARSSGQCININVYFSPAKLAGELSWRLAGWPTGSSADLSGPRHAHSAPPTPFGWASGEFNPQSGSAASPTASEGGRTPSAARPTERAHSRWLAGWLASLAARTRARSLGRPEWAPINHGRSDGQPDSCLLRLFPLARPPGSQLVLWWWRRRRRKLQRPRPRLSPTDPARRTRPAREIFGKYLGSNDAQWDWRAKGGERES